MKLITFNFLTSKCIRGVKVGYPLKLQVAQTEVVETSFDREFVSRLMPRLDWAVIYSGAESAGCCEGLPKELGENFTSDLDLLQKIHHVLLEVDIVEGKLECPETGRVFPITGGIPNMLLNEDEI